MATWRLAKSIVTLLAEVNAAWPDRDKASDGTIGDLRHQNETTSDHNPWVIDPATGLGVVRALDVDAGPGLNPNPAPIGDAVAECARRAGASGHPAMGQGSYVIWRYRIASAHTPAWQWRPFDGDPHTSHPHISVGTAKTSYDSTAPWGLLIPEEDVPLDYADVKFVWTAGPRDADGNPLIGPDGKPVPSFFNQLKIPVAVLGTEVAALKVQVDALAQAVAGGGIDVAAIKAAAEAGAKAALDGAHIVTEP